MIDERVKQLELELKSLMRKLKEYRVISFLDDSFFPQDYWMRPISLVSLQDRIAALEESASLVDLQTRVEVLEKKNTPVESEIRFSPFFGMVDKKGVWVSDPNLTMSATEQYAFNMQNHYSYMKTLTLWDGSAS